MKNRHLSLFRNIFANVAIIFVLLGLSGFTYVGGVLNVFSSNVYDPIYHGNLQNKNVSLIINIYWGTEFVLPILDILEQKNVKATFFVGGCWVAENADILKTIFQKGHEIGNHGYYHKDHKKIDYNRNIEEISITHSVVKGIINFDMNLFMPPSGSFSSSTLEGANQLGYKTIMWSKDTIDWRDKDEQLIYTRATKNLKNGDFVLMHPTKHTLLALEDILDYYVSSGFNVVTVSQNLL